MGSPFLNNATMPDLDPIGTFHNREDNKPDILRGVFITPPWIQWLTTLGTQVSNGATRIQGVTIPSGAGSIAPTDMTGGGASSGLFEIKYYLHVVVPAGVSSSLQITFNWTDRGVAMTATGAAMTGNTTTTYQSGELSLFHADAATPITYSLTYASAGVPAMQYDAWVVLSLIQAAA